MPPSSRSYRLTPRARADLEEIWLYPLETWSLEQADTYHEQIISVIEDVAADRKHGRKVDEIRHGYFRVRARSHTIFYRRAAYGVEVVRVLHERMDFGRHLV